MCVSFHAGVSIVMHSQALPCVNKNSMNGGLSAIEDKYRLARWLLNLHKLNLDTHTHSRTHTHTHIHAHTHTHIVTAGVSEQPTIVLRSCIILLRTWSSVTMKSHRGLPAWLVCVCACVCVCVCEYVRTT